MTDIAHQVPVTIFTGFLGSGKTTIISHLIDILQSQNQQVIFIKNEIGSEDIDGQILKGKNIKTKELLNGCICCTLVGPFMAAVDEVIDSFKPSRIIIEASGAADPSAIALMVSSHPRLVRDGVISIVDVVNFEGYTDLSQTARHQTQFTDLIVFNKVELVDIDRKQTVVEYVRELNHHSPIIEAPHGKLNPDVVFGISCIQLNELLSSKKVTDHEHHLEEDEISTFALELEPVQLSKLTQWLTSLPKSVFRVKGFVQDHENKAWIVNKVGKRIETVPYTNAEVTTGTLVFIGFRVLELKNEIQTTLIAIQDQESSSSVEPSASVESDSSESTYASNR